VIHRDRAAAEATVYSLCSLCQHDWSSIRADPQMRATEALILYAQEQGLRITSYRAYYEACKCKNSRADRDRTISNRVQRV
jgi:hypothetical protein